MMKTQHILHLLELLAEKEKQSLELAGFGVISEAICKTYAEKNQKPPDNEVVSQRYLYDLYRESLKKMEMGINKSSRRNFHMDIIVQHLGYKNYREFALNREGAVSDVLKSCEGSWWSMVRANAGEKIFKAPVKIYLNESRQKMSLELRGKERIFSGEISENGNCISCSLESGTSKRMALIFKIGHSASIEVLQGVFCGISSAGDPISGREILVKEKELVYGNMEWSQHDLDDESIDYRIRKYFSEHAKNCIKIKNVSNFDLNDLLD